MASFLLFMTTILPSLYVAQQPAVLPTEPIYDACWQIESLNQCNADYYAQNLGCQWDTFDESCMCQMVNNEKNIIYLIDVSLSAVPQQSQFDDIAALIEDVTKSTLAPNAFHQIILYDDNQQIQPPQIDATQIDITQYSRSIGVDLRSAILSAIETFDALDQKKRALVLFSGQIQSEYANDLTEICPLRAMLSNAEITLIIVSYTYNDFGEQRNLKCLIRDDALSEDAHNSIPYIAISGASASGWNGFPIEAKLSWDICSISSNPTKPTLIPTLHPTEIPTFKEKECKNNETNWKLHYLRSFVVEKKRKRKWSMSESDSQSQSSDFYKKQKLAICLVYELIITDFESICYGEASSVSFWMINIPKKCANEITINEIKNAFYPKPPNDVDIVYFGEDETFGFGIKYDEASKEPNVPSRQEYTLCFERCRVDAFDVVETTWFAEDDNGYFSSDGRTYIADICVLAKDSASDDSDSDSYSF